jgi:hypothetical protein
MVALSAIGALGINLRAMFAKCVLARTMKWTKLAPWFSCHTYLCREIENRPIHICSLLMLHYATSERLQPRVITDIH